MELSLLHVSVKRPLLSAKTLPVIPLLLMDAETLQVEHDEPSLLKMRPVISPAQAGTAKRTVRRNKPPIFLAFILSPFRRVHAEVHEHSVSIRERCVKSSTSSA